MFEKTGAVLEAKTSDQAFDERVSFMQMRMSDLCLRIFSASDGADGIFEVFKLEKSSVYGLSLYVAHRPISSTT